MKRQKKHQLELSINRVLDVMREDAEEDDSSASIDGKVEGTLETDQVTQSSPLSVVLPTRS